VNEWLYPWRRGRSNEESSVALKSLVWVHYAACLTSAGYGAYHLSFGIKAVGCASVVAGIFVVLAIFSLRKDRWRNELYLGFYISLLIAISVTAYHYGIRGMVLAFPLITSSFYILPYKMAMLVSIAKGSAVWFASRPHLAPDESYGVAVALTVTILISAAFARLMTHRAGELVADASIDYLTGVYNRRGFTEKANELLDSSKKLRLNAFLFGFDINDFKLINDRHGHHVGDLALQAFVQNISLNLKSIEVLKAANTSHIFARRSGDEFILLLGNFPEVELDSVRTKLLSALQSDYHISGKDITVSACMGMARAVDYDWNLVNMEKAADLELYYEKREKA
jgi:diguanylate cyclase (GGDEF)-like protein